MNDYFRVGVIANTHGIKGEVKVFPTTDDISRFDDLEEVFLDTKNGYEKLTVKSVKYQKNMVILGFDQFDNINQVEGLKNLDLYVDREHAIPLEGNQVYIADLIGCSVETDEGKTLGIVKDVMKTGANDVYVIEMPDGNEVLLPGIKECILEKDVKNKKVLVHLMKGLLD